METVELLLLEEAKRSKLLRVMFGSSCQPLSTGLITVTGFCGKD